MVSHKIHISYIVSLIGANTEPADFYFLTQADVLRAFKTVAPVKIRDVTRVFVASVVGTRLAADSGHALETVSPDGWVGRGEMEVDSG